MEHLDNEMEESSDEMLDPVNEVTDGEKVMLMIAMLVICLTYV
jgi:hypothetical protein